MKDKYIFIISCILLIILLILNKIQKSEKFTPVPNVPKIHIDFLKDFERVFENNHSSEKYNLFINELYKKPELVNQINTCYYSISKDEMYLCLEEIINSNDMKDIIKNFLPDFYTNIINPSIQQMRSTLLAFTIESANSLNKDLSSTTIN
jgi:hypothetical protein